MFTLLLCWIVPETIQTAMEKKEHYPFTYFSSIREEFCSTEHLSKEEMVRKDESNNHYTEEQFDSIMPLFYYRQMLSTGRMPDSIHGYPITMRSIRQDGFYLRYNPKDIDTPEIPLYPLLEAYTGRVKLEMSDDLFRIKNGIEFIDVESNKVNEDKSDYFAQALKKKGITFPVSHCYGNPTTRKPYDEGYFILDAQNHLFHMKMVNSKPFIREVKEARDIQIVHFMMYEIGNRNFYGFLFDNQNQVYLITTDKYKLQKLPFKVDTQKEQMLIMANPLYWTVQITNDQGRDYYAVDSHDLKIVRTMHRQRSEDTWDKYHQYVFPLRIHFEAYNSAYRYPRFYFGNIWSIALCAFILVLFIAIDIKRRKKKKGIAYLVILLTGIPGVISSLLLRKL